MNAPESRPGAADPWHERQMARIAARLGGLFTRVIRRCPGGDRPVQSIDAQPWRAEVESALGAMQAELDVVLADRERIPAFHEVSEEQRPISPDDRWKTFFLVVAGQPIPVNAERCPRTLAALRAVPGLRTAMFSIMAPGTRVPPHEGVYAGLMRLLLPLRVPPPEGSSALVVAGETLVFRTGRSIVFDDTFTHAACNLGTSDRVVLFVDFLRPLPFPLNWINRIVVAVFEQGAFFRRPLRRLRGD